MENIENQLKIYKTIVSDTLSVRQTENLISNNQQKKYPLKKQNLPSNFQKDLSFLNKKLKTEVKISLKSNNKGTVSIPFNDIDEYKRIIKIISGEN